METAIYYRGHELISEADWQKIIKVWGETPFNFIERHIIEEDSSSGLHIVTELLAIIWTNSRLNERDTALRERIKKGLTYSRAYNLDYVERRLLCKLIFDALDEYNKIAEEPVERYNVPFKEFYRLFNIPTKTIMDRVKEDERKTMNIPEPPRKIAFTQYFGKHQTDQCSVFQENFICVTEPQHHLVNNLSKQAYKKFPFLCKLHFSYLDKDYIQVYVYDNYGSTKALENVLCFLEDNGVKIK